MKELPPALFIGKVRLPESTLFDYEISKLAVASRPNSRYKPRDKSEFDRRRASEFLIEGLFQVYSSLNSELRLSVPFNPDAYSNDPRLNPFSYRLMKQTVVALVALGWASKFDGYIRNDGAHVLTTLRPAGYLLEIFRNHGICWQRLVHRQNEKTIFLREKRKHKKTLDVKSKTVTEVITLPTPNSPQVKRMRENLKRINDHISSQAICLHLKNETLTALSKEIASKNNPTVSFFGKPKKKGRHINFYDVLLYRVFSAGSMELGGRFYGGWWQIIPSRFRPFITINGLATYEIDYSEFHPRLLYAISCEKLPSGDLYDFGYRLSGHPKWDPTQEPYKSVRAIHKKFFNAYLNDPKGEFRLEYDDKLIIGMNESFLQEQMFLRHQLLQDKEGIGLQLQYLDSQIAEYVMLELLKEGITCLPVHDSFIVDRRFINKLQDAMNRGYQTYAPGLPKLKFDIPDRYSEFQMTFREDGELDREAMFAMHESAIHNLYVHSWRHRTSTHL